MLLQCKTRKIQAIPTVVHSQSKKLETFKEGEATLENVAAHQLYLEKLQFELNTLRLWSSGIQKEIIEETHKVHLQLARMIRELQRSHIAQPWVESWQSAPQQIQPPPAPSSASSGSFPVKAPPAPRAVPTQSSSMASVPKGSSLSS